MHNRTVVWMLAVLAILLVVVPLLAMASGMLYMGGNMMGMSAVGVIWMLLVAAVVIAPVVMLVRGASRV